MILGDNASQQYCQYIRVVEMSGNGSDNSSCVLDEYNTQPYLLVAGVRIVTGLISLLCGLLLIILFAYTRNQRRVANQILVFFLSVSVSLHSLSVILGRVDFSTERALLDSYCLFAGPLQLYSAWTEYVCVMCISCNLLAQVTCQPTGRRLNWVYFSLIFTLPLLLCWIPFTGQAYGSAGPWCGIRTSTENCQQFLYGVVLRLVLVGLPVLVLLLTTTTLSLATWISLKHSLKALENNTFSKQNTVDKSLLLKELRILVWCPPLYPTLKLLLLVNLLYDTARPSSPQLALWLLQALLSPLAGSLTAAVIGANTETNTRARLRSWLLRHLRWSRGEQSEGGKRRVSEYECDLDVSYGDSIAGVIDKNRRERVRKNSTPSQLPSVSE